MASKAEKTRADDAAAVAARMRADAWARSVPGTPYGSTRPVLTGGVTEYQEQHPWEFPELEAARV